jgi:hypothetical protein
MKLHPLIAIPSRGKPSGHRPWSIHRQAKVGDINWTILPFFRPFRLRFVAMSRLVKTRLELTDPADGAAARQIQMRQVLAPASRPGSPLPHLPRQNELPSRGKLPPDHLSNPALGQPSSFAAGIHPGIDPHQAFAPLSPHPYG